MLMVDPTCIGQSMYDVFETLSVILYQWHGEKTAVAKVANQANLANGS